MGRPGAFLDWRGLLLAFAALPAFAAGPAAHVHGAARLQVAVDGATLTVNLESPLDSLLGFEHQPRSDKEQAAVRAMADKFKGELFVPTPAARCAPAGVKLASPVLAKVAAGGDGHLDLDGEFVFRCAQPAALRDIEVRLFAAFPHLRQLDAEIIGPRGQSAARLTPQQPRLSW